MASNNKEHLGRLMLFAAALVWGAAFVVVKGALDAVAPMRLIAIRSTIGMVVLFLLRLNKIRSITKKQVFYGFITGLATFVGTILQTYGLNFTTPGKSAFITAAYCVIVPFIVWMMYKKRPDGYNFIAAAMSLAGIGFIALDAGLAISIGDVLTFFCAIMFALQMFFIDKYGKESDPVIFVALQFMTAAILAWALSFALGEPKVEWTPSVIMPMLYLGFIASAGGMLFQNIGQLYVEASAASLICALESVFAVIFSLIFYPGESLTPKICIGFALVFIGVVISETKLSFLKKRKFLPQK